MTNWTPVASISTGWGSPASISSGWSPQTSISTGWIGGAAFTVAGYTEMGYDEPEERMTDWDDLSAPATTWL